MIQQVETLQVKEAIEETMFTEQTPEEEFGLVEGPLGHLTDTHFEDELFSSAFWEADTEPLALGL